MHIISGSVCIMEERVLRKGLCYETVCIMQVKISILSVEVSVLWSCELLEMVANERNQI